MKRRHVYVLLFAVPALLASIVAAALMAAATAGALWLFVYGDNPWPETATTLLGAALIIGGAALWLALLWIAWSVGRQQESRPALNMAHVGLAIVVTAVLTAVIMGRVRGQNVFSTPSDSLACADLCQSRGFPGSGTPPLDSGDRTCRCYDAQGREEERFDLSAVEAP